ncbi:MAG: FixH family protein [Sulfuritalea sp.]|nr:FixH family protein [Sulfuritalea sp.]
MPTAVNKDCKPWYREPWPWFLMAGPSIVVVAALFTAWLAWSTRDGLVTEDYYKEGLAIAETIARSKRAEELGIGIGLSLANEQVRVRLTGAEAEKPPALRITLSHPTRAGFDRNAELSAQGGAYVGRLNLPAAGHWLLLVEDQARTWRVMGSVVLPAANEVTIGAAAS